LDTYNKIETPVCKIIIEFEEFTFILEQDDQIIHVKNSEYLKAVT